MDKLKHLPVWVQIALAVLIGFLVLQAVNLWATGSADNTDCLVTAVDDC